MKCMYYLAPSLISTQKISEDLGDVGIDDWLLHVVSKDEAGLKKEKIHSSNWLETTDLIRDGFIGANFGFIAGAVAAGIMMMFEPFGPDVPGVAYFFLVAVAYHMSMRDAVLGISGVHPSLAHPSSAIHPHRPGDPDPRYSASRVADRAA